MGRAVVISLLLTAAACSKPGPPPQRVDPEQLENFIAAQEAALNRSEADEAAENAATASNEIEHPDGKPGAGLEENAARPSSSSAPGKRHPR
jgi:hypothetical protein